MAERKSFLLRMSGELWSELEAWAQDDLRSVNGQIEFLLRDAVQRRRGKSLPGSGRGATPRASASPPDSDPPADRDPSDLPLP